MRAGGDEGRGAERSALLGGGDVTGDVNVPGQRPHRIRVAVGAALSIGQNNCVCFWKQCIIERRTTCTCTCIPVSLRAAPRAVRCRTGDFVVHRARPNSQPQQPAAPQATSHRKPHLGQVNCSGECLCSLPATEPLHTGGSIVGGAVCLAVITSNLSETIPGRHPVKLL